MATISLLTDHELGRQSSAVAYSMKEILEAIQSSGAYSDPEGVSLFENDTVRRLKLDPGQSHCVWDEEFEI